MAAEREGQTTGGRPALLLRTQDPEGADPSTPTSRELPAEGVSTVMAVHVVRHSSCRPPKGRTVRGGGSEHSGRITNPQSLGPTTKARASASRHAPLPAWAAGGSARTPPPWAT